VSFYHWAMRNGAPILFAISLIIFVISVGSSVGMLNLGEFQSEPPRPFGESIGGLWNLFAMVGNALSRSALTFFGACFLYRLDAYFVSGAAAK